MDSNQRTAMLAEVAEVMSSNAGQSILAMIDEEINGLAKNREEANDQFSAARVLGMEAGLRRIRDQLERAPGNFRALLPPRDSAETGAP